MKQDERVIENFQRSIMNMFCRAAGFSFKYPALAFSFLKAAVWQTRAAKVRRSWAKKGISVPAVMIISVTNSCNLSCIGCYARTLRNSSDKEMSDAELSRIVAEARALGISIIFLSGGEPLLRSGILKITRRFPDEIFILFTNGLLLDGDIHAAMKRQHNVIPVVSIEGSREQTDMRRGKGIHDRLGKTMARFHADRIFWGVSFTVDRTNLADVTSEKLVRKYMSLGCRVFFFVEYVPVTEGTGDLILTPPQRRLMIEEITRIRQRLPGLFVMFPGDEDEYDGCLSAGRGFVHVNARGSVEPCPFAPYSDVSLRNTRLADAIKSRLLAEIRERHSMLKETGGGCALWADREWVRKLVLDRH